MRLRHWAALAAFAILFIAFDHMMRADRERMCSSDATAFEGC